MHFRQFLPVILVVCCSGPVQAASEQSSGSVTPLVQELEQKMLGNEQVMALILSLQNDPEMQALLNDPAVLSAVQAGDIETLKANPRFMKLLDNATVKEIQKRVGE